MTQPIYLSNECANDYLVDRTAKAAAVVARGRSDLQSADFFCRLYKHGSASPGRRAARLALSLLVLSLVSLLLLVVVVVVSLYCYYDCYYYLY